MTGARIITGMKTAAIMNTTLSPRTILHHGTTAPQRTTDPRNTTAVQNIAADQNSAANQTTAAKQKNATSQIKGADQRTAFQQHTASQQNTTSRQNMEPHQKFAPHPGKALDQRITDHQQPTISSSTAVASKSMESKDDTPDHVPTIYGDLEVCGVTATNSASAISTPSEAEPKAARHNKVATDGDEATHTEITPGLDVAAPCKVNTIPKTFVPPHRKYAMGSAGRQGIPTLPKKEATQPQTTHRSAVSALPQDKTCAKSAKIDALPKIPIPSHRKLALESAGPKDTACQKPTAHRKVAPQPKTAPRSGVRALPEDKTCVKFAAISKMAEKVDVKAEARLAKRIAAETREVVRRDEEESDKPFAISDST